MREEEIRMAAAYQALIAEMNSINVRVDAMKISIAAGQDKYSINDFLIAEQDLLRLATRLRTEI